MTNVIFAAPLLSENAARSIGAILALDDVRLGVISMEPLEKLAPALQNQIAAHWRLDDVLNIEDLAGAVEQLSRRLGRVDRLFAAYEQLQVPIAEVRERFGIEGMRVETAHNFRDKARMKKLFSQYGLPCARHRRASTAQEAWSFAEENGYPVVVKPVAGAGAQQTFRCDDFQQLETALRISEPSREQPVLLEEYIVGDEHSMESITVGGETVWQSLTHYYPTPLEVVRNRWIQWCIVLPREVDQHRYDDIRSAAARALQVLGMDTGLTHMEWFRRRDGTVAISEVAARPPGAQIMSLISYANDIDFERLWARVMVMGKFDRPVQKWATGAAFLRGQGEGRVRAIHGLEEAQKGLGDVVVESRLPVIGQPAASTYEGDGFIIVRHEETSVVEEALKHLISSIRVELS